MIKKKSGPLSKMISVGFTIFCFLGPAVLADDLTALRVGTLHRGNGEVLKNVLVLIKGGKVEFVGIDSPLPKGTNVLEFKEGVATPGFIAANAYLRVSAETKIIEIEPRGEDYAWLKADKVLALNEGRSEVTPELNALYSVDPHSEDFARAWRSGVTCLYIAPGNLNVFNGTGTVLKAIGRTPQEMVVKNMVHLKVTFGHEPAYLSRGAGFDPRLYTPRPQHALRVDFIFRNAFVKLQNKGPIPDSALDAQELILRKVLQGEIPLRIRARSYIDIKAALRAMDEFGFKWILEEGVDAYRYLDELKSRSVPVIYGPIYRPEGRSNFNAESDYYKAQTPLLLARKGILFAFQNDNKSPISSLRDEAIFAVQLGLDKETALKALTSHAARILGVEDRLGTIEKGKDADLLIFNGDPLDPSSRLEKVIIGGKMLDPNK